MTQQPTHGGSFRRQQDGTLAPAGASRVEETKTETPTAPAKAVPGEPVASPKAKTKR
jgi:hypothetical protein